MNISNLPQSVTNSTEAKQVIDYLMSVLGGGFHPDTPIADYINLLTNEQTFTAAEISRLQPLLDQCFGVMSDGGCDYVYSRYLVENFNN